jgi:asparagine synthase (glutamine-hydrolysing)
MCGIVGIYFTSIARPGRVESLNERPLAPEEVLSRMGGRIQHRGPDDQGSYVSFGSQGCVALGHTRLAILDLSPAGHQPMSGGEAERLEVTFNGEIYNFKELRQELGTLDRQWKTQTDTEVILRAYERWGVDSFRRLRGMFAFALWDESREQLLLTRDVFGIKPLYYFHDGNRFIFASEMRALLASGLVPKEICPDGFASYLSSGAVAAPLSIIKGVRMLLPGNYLTVSCRNGQLDLVEKSYTDDSYHQHNGDLPANRRDAVIRLREVLEDSVRHHLVSDVPVGAFLSGGIDSSAIVALMRRVSSERPRTFSVVFAEKEFTEAEYGRLISRQFDTEHREIELSESDMLSLLPHALRDMDHPTIDGINTYVVAKAVHDAGIKVALSGLGGDELFAGYPSFRRAQLLRKLSAVPVGLRTAAAKGGRALLHRSVQQRKAWDLLGGELSPRHAYTTSRQLFSSREVAELMGVRSPQNGRSTSTLHLAGSARDDFINEVSLCELTGYMADMLLRDTDQMSMAHSLEVRVPFIDSVVVPYVLSLPGSWKVEPQRPKSLLLDALGDLLPEQIWRRRKMGFTLPFERWMHSELKAELDETLDSGLVFGASNGQRAALRVWSDLKNTPRRERWSRPWALYILTKWCQLNGVRV